MLALFNKIIATETLPSDWSKIVVVMLFKKGTATDPGNHRRIALVNCIIKIFTQIINRRIRKWAEKEKLIPDEQAGFQQGKSCADNVYNLIELLQTQTRFRGASAWILFIDFKKRFDSVPHKKLWLKLATLGLSPKMINIVKSLYDNASIQVKSGDKLINDIQVTQGVLQGEVLSPLLFTLYL